MYKVPIIAIAFMVAACGGSGGSRPDTTGQGSTLVISSGTPPTDDSGDTMDEDERIPDATESTSPEEFVEQFAVALPGFDCRTHYGSGTDCDLYTVDAFDIDNLPTYQISALPPRTRSSDGLHMPVYHDHEQLYGIGVTIPPEHRRVFVGLDQAPDELPSVSTRGTTAIGFGTLDDGIDRPTLEAFIAESLPSDTVRWETTPTVHISRSLEPEQTNWVIAAVELVNATLPPNARMRIGEPNRPVS